MGYLTNQIVGEATESDKGKGKTGKDHSQKAIVQNAQGAAKLLYKRFYPCYIRAFLDAADIGKNGKVRGTKTATKDDTCRDTNSAFCAFISVFMLLCTMPSAS